MAGLKVVAFAAIGPGPLAGVLLADMGADMIGLARAGGRPRDRRQIVSRGRPCGELDPKTATDRETARDLMAEGRWAPPGGGAPFYSTYRCAAGRFSCVGALKPQLHADLPRIADRAEPRFFQQWDRALWPAIQAHTTEVFATRTRDQWAAVFEDSDAGIAAARPLEEAPQHPGRRARGTLAAREGVVKAALIPRFLATPSRLPERPVGKAATAEAVAAQRDGAAAASRIASAHPAQQEVLHAA
ncbi:CoA transferase [Xanthobacter sp.]|uniref:CoA transferase n=1 Tax=Xanthobacter sp. TaxID=35809 RepID=UPI0025E6DEEF|nr:CoA transferase [Xanthobacter sp.]